MRLGLVGLSTETQRHWRARVGDDVRHSREHFDLADAMVARPPETVLFRLPERVAGDLVDAIRRARSMSPSTTLLLMGRSASATVVAELICAIDSGETHTTMTHLTPRESEVLTHIRCGLTNREIAGRLGVSISTVNKHVENILDKLPARNRAQAAAEAPNFMDDAVSVRSGNGDRP
jgi:DNA-binding NarL/FixJ family response regulator